MKVNEIKILINKIEEDFKFEGGSVDFIGDFRTKVAELQEVFYSEGGMSTFNRTPIFMGSATGFAPMPTVIAMGFSGHNTDQDEVLGPQTETAFTKLCEWLRDEGKLV